MSIGMCSVYSVAYRCEITRLSTKFLRQFTIFNASTITFYKVTMAHPVYIHFFYGGNLDYNNHYYEHQHHLLQKIHEKNIKITNRGQ